MFPPLSIICISSVFFLTNSPLSSQWLLNSPFSNYFPSLIPYHLQFLLPSLLLLPPLFSMASLFFRMVCFFVFPSLLAPFLSLFSLMASFLALSIKFVNIIIAGLYPADLTCALFCCCLNYSTAWEEYLLVLIIVHIEHWLRSLQYCIPRLTR